ncbi:CheR family methyltransferase [uncultured Abyssibacter sp.]|uniref:CheR family methyltransferase n=1 Tax=uncultured Abyssibacter sp. TaxID=2320202 RepID=UPI0032B23BC8
MTAFASAAPALGVLPPLSNHSFERIARFLRREAGIELPPDKHTLVQSRLRKHVVAGGYGDYDSYVDETLSRRGIALITLIDALTTNKTAFFREADHFRYLQEQWLPTLSQLAGSQRPLRVWSAGCSAGQEPYTLALVLLDALELYPQLRFEILATDLSTAMLKIAVNGIYSVDDVAPVPESMRHRYLMRSRKAGDNRVAMGPELREHVRFQRFNLVTDAYAFEAPFDLVFCRNVMIYFSNSTREAVVRRIHDVMVPGALLMIGHSESLSGFKTPLRYVEPTIYTRPLEN